MNQALPRNGNCYATVVMVDISPVDMQFLLCTPRGDVVLTQLLSL